MDVNLQRRARAKKLIALILVAAVAAAVLLAPGSARFSARTSVARAYKAYQTALGTISGADIVAEIEELSSASYAGRQAGSAGGRLAADHIAAQFAAMGIEPLIADSFFQEFAIAYSHPAAAPEARLRDVSGRDLGSLKYGQDIAYSLWSDSAAISKAPVMFIGSWDKIGDVDLQGSVALALPPANATITSLATALEQARAAGAGALLAAGLDQATLTSYWDVESYVPGIAMLGLGNTASEMLLQRTGKGIPAWYAEITAAAQAGRAFAPIDTGLTLDLDWPIENDSQRTARNVIGVIPGTKGVKEGRSVLLTAHYDHLGAIPGGPYWPGAWDNSSGVAVMLAVARTIASVHPDINVIVAAWDAEERGLVGSAHFAANLPVPAGSLSGIVNLDCVGARFDFSLERTRASALTHRLESAAARFKINMSEAPVKPWSDAASFVDVESMESIQIFDAGDPYQVPFLHEPSDTIANLKPDALERIARTVALAIIAASEDDRSK